MQHLSMTDAAKEGSRAVMAWLRAALETPDDIGTLTSTAIQAVLGQIPDWEQDPDAVLIGMADALAVLACRSAAIRGFTDPVALERCLIMSLRRQYAQHCHIMALAGRGGRT